MTLATTLLLAHIVVGFVATVLISANRRPSAAIAWVLAIIFIPFLGAAFFLLVGVGRLPRRRREKQREVTEEILTRTDGLAQVSHREEWPGWLPSAVALNSNLGALPMVGGNTVDLIDDYTGSFDQMIADIDAARDHVHVEFYILVLDPATAPFFDALARAVARGVTVRVLSDHLSGLMFPRRKQTIEALRAMGAQWHAMLPLRPLKGQWQRPDLRNHRKLVVVDGRVGFTGSQNLIDSSYLKKKNVARGLHWHELMVRITGPAVRELDAVFITDWFSETDQMLPLDTTPVVLEPGADRLDAQVLPSGPSFDNDNNLKLYALAIHNAERRVSITSPYFVPDESILLAIVTAASRGLDVELFVSAVGDQVLVYHAQRSYYEALLRAGVSIYLYRSPTVLHSKHFTIDDDTAVIGSSNMDIRSFSLNMEVSVMVHGREFVDRMRTVEDDYRANSDKLELAAWLDRPVAQKVLDNLARLTSSFQ
ncbi:cardiolipin synthetase 2 [Sanguibacter gelidistatuariae]|uniref:Cardiolipin synthase n=1 Tax=Sanguibacter gelidistatuariae TaxID=1814289 RepID=A0A1G6GPI9_9MICO|nr:cardiolipin synthase [Sanguibacter gelidistatuariae]SDB83851.1 cardiolipin synthetase 2 [Sanguibacter gelidistatuariae]